MARNKHDAERSRLEEEVATCRRTRGAGSRAAVEAEARLKKLEQQRRGHLADQARGKADASKQVAAVEQQIAEAKHEHARQLELASVAKEAGDAAERNLKRHLAANLDHFMKGADKLADKALADREAVLKAIEVASESEQVARTEWNTLRNACRSQREDIGDLPQPTFDDKITRQIREAPRPEPKLVARSRKRSIGAPNLPAAIKALWPKREGPGDWTPIPAEADPLDY